MYSIPFFCGRDDPPEAAADRLLKGAVAERAAND